GEPGAAPPPALPAVPRPILRGELEPAGLTAGPGTLDAQRLPPPAARPGSGPPRATNLPAQLTSFVGREDELELLGRLLDESRLVTLTGPGGAGETRPAIRASAAPASPLPARDGVVPPAPAQGAARAMGWGSCPWPPAGVALVDPQAGLAPLGVNGPICPADPGEAMQAAPLPPLDRLADALASRKLALVLDNCEHLLDAVAALAD